MSAWSQAAVVRNRRRIEARRRLRKAEGRALDALRTWLANTGQHVDPASAAHATDALRDAGRAWLEMVRKVART